MGIGYIGIGEQGIFQWCDACDFLSAVAAASVYDNICAEPDKSASDLGIYHRND